MTAIPDPSPAMGNTLGPPPGLLRGNFDRPSGLVAVAPLPQPAGTPGAAKRQRVVGLVPAVAGSMHPMIVREAPRVKLDPGEVSKTRHDLRRARKDAEKAEALFIGTSGDPMGQLHRDATANARVANELVAALVRKLAEMEATNASRPIRVVLATVREPGECADVLQDARYVCLHDGCRTGPGWADEAAMRRAHPTNAEMVRAQQCHVFALLCEAPIDPLDPEGERVGYVAPVGKDGTTVALAVAAATDDDERDEKIAGLEAMVTEMRAALDALTKGKAGKA